MSLEGMTKIKAKLQELTTLIKEETAEERKEIQDEILQSVSDLKTAIEERVHAVGEKISKGQKSEIVLKASDSLVEAINKMKEKLHSK